MDHRTELILGELGIDRRGRAMLAYHRWQAEGMGRCCGPPTVWADYAPPPAEPIDYPDEMAAAWLPPGPFPPP